MYYSQLSLASCGIKIYSSTTVSQYTVILCLLSFLEAFVVNIESLLALHIIETLIPAGNGGIVRVGVAGAQRILANRYR